jgi:hypothetical protein
VPAAALVAFALLTASRFAVFEATNGYRESDLQWSTAVWTAEVTLPLLLAVVLLVRGWTRWRTAAVATGVLGGVLLTMAGEVVQWWAAFVGNSYRPGPAVALLVSGTLVLVPGVALGRVGLRRRPGLRRDAVAEVAGVVVAFCLVLWLFAIGSADLPAAQWVFYKIGGLLFTLACVPLAVLRLAEGQRLFALAAVTTTAVGQVVAVVALLIAQPGGYDVPSLLTAMLAVLLATGAAYLGQLAPRMRRGDRQPATIA